MQAPQSGKSSVTHTIYLKRNQRKMRQKKTTKEIELTKRSSLCSIMYASSRSNRAGKAIHSNFWDVFLSLEIDKLQ